MHSKTRFLTVHPTSDFYDQDAALRRDPKSDGTSRSLSIQLRLPPPLQQQCPGQFFWYPYLFKTYCNLCYYLLLCPFRISTSRIGYSQGPTAVTLRTNLVQKVLCYSLHLILFILGLLRIVSLIFYYEIIRPTSFFYFMAILIGVIQNQVFLYEFRTKSSVIREICEGTAAVDVPMGKKMITTLIVTIAFIFEVFMAFWNHSGVVAYVKIGAASAEATAIRAKLFYSYHQQIFGYDHGTPVFNGTSRTTLNLAWTWVWAAFWQYMKILWWLSQMLCILSGVAILEIVTKYSENIMKDKDLDEGRHAFVIRSSKKVGMSRNELRKAFDLYGKMKVRVRQINTFMSSLYIWTFINLILITSFVVIQIIDKEINMSRRVVYAVWIAHFPLMMLIGAQAFDKGKHCKEYLQRLECCCCCGGVNRMEKSLYIEGTAYQVGQMGGDFFSVTYEFLGETVSLMLTYVFVVIQYSR